MTGAAIRDLDETRKLRRTLHLIVGVSRIISSDSSNVSLVIYKDYGFTSDTP